MKYNSLASAIPMLLHSLKIAGKTVDTGHWQGIETGGRPDLVTRELINVNFTAPMCATIEEAQEWIKPNLPWAEDHFQERVAREPTNPGEQYKNWPWWRGQEAFTMQDPHNRNTVIGGPEGMKGAGARFTHTYQERFWPRNAGEGDQGPWRTFEGRDNWGIRYEYGDLDDVVSLLFKYPYTRQATFPIFFPEDTGAVHGGRIPCTLHYHFLLRDEKLHMWYPIRSCDAVRHFRDDVYMANRLCQWVIQELVGKELAEPGSRFWQDVDPGDLDFKAYSFHVHMGDIHLL